MHNTCDMLLAAARMHCRPWQVTLKEVLHGKKRAVLFGLPGARASRPRQWHDA